MTNIASMISMALNEGHNAGLSVVLIVVAVRIRSLRAGAFYGNFRRSEARWSAENGVRRNHNPEREDGDRDRKYDIAEGSAEEFGHAGIRQPSRSDRGDDGDADQRLDLFGQPASRSGRDREACQRKSSTWSPQTAAAWKAVSPASKFVHPKLDRELCRFSPRPLVTAIVEAASLTAFPDETATTG
jgi:hypothetical protein